MTANSDELNGRAAFARELQRYRRRLQTIRALRAALIAGVVAFGVVTATTIAADIATPTAGVAVVLATLLASVGVAVWAFVRSPNAMRTAAILDRAIGRNDCLVTAAECLAGGETLDPVGSLVVREGLRQLVAASPRSALPFELPRRILPVAGMLALVIVASTFVRGRLTAPAQVPTGQAGEASSPSDRIDTSQAGRSGTAPRGEEPGRGRSSPRNDAAPPGSTRSSETRAGELAPKEVGRGPASAARESATGRSSGTPSSAAAGGSGAAGGGPGGATPSSRMVRGAGGVAGGSLRPQTAPDSSAGAGGTAPYAIRYDSAWKRAQTAVARDRVPADLRQLVKDYFVAIRPSQP